MPTSLSSLFRLSKNEEDVIQCYRELSATDQQFFLEMVRLMADAASPKHEKVVSLNTRRKPSGSN